jgi:hypothetical protein
MSADSRTDAAQAGSSDAMGHAAPSRGRKVAFWLIAETLLIWGFAIKLESIPAILRGQLTVWVLYAALLWIFYRCLLRSRQAPPGVEEKAVAFTWRGFLFCFGSATAVTTGARLWLHKFAVVQMAVFFCFYLLVGLALLVGAALYAARRVSPQQRGINTQ